MDESIRQQQVDDIDSGLPPAQVLQRTLEAEQAQLDAALTELSSSADDQEILHTYGVDMAAMRRGIDLDGSLFLP